ncbi:MAG: hypothetical protein DIU54_001650 [Acidobacteriota bacterium]
MMRRAFLLHPLAATLGAPHQPAREDAADGDLAAPVAHVAAPLPPAAAKAGAR